MFVLRSLSMIHKNPQATKKKTKATTTTQFNGTENKSLEIFKVYHLNES